MLRRTTSSFRVAAAVFGVTTGLVGTGDSAAQLLSPRAQITSGPAGEVPSRDATFIFQGEERAPLSTSSCRLDGGPWAMCSSPVTYTGLVGGSHRFEVKLQGALVDPTPDVREWVVALDTETTACGIDPCVNPVQYDGRKVRRKRSRRRDVSGCAYGGNRLGRIRPWRYAEATTCLILVARSNRGLLPAARNSNLALAAREHVADMIKRRFLAHVSPDGLSPAARITATGFLRGARYWAVGEVLAYGGPRMTPAGLVRSWLRSPPHRGVLLTAALRQIGVSVAPGTPRAGRRGVTAAAEFGHRD